MERKKECWCTVSTVSVFLTNGLARAKAIFIATSAMGDGDNSESSLNDLRYYSSCGRRTGRLWIDRQHLHRYITSSYTATLLRLLPLPQNITSHSHTVN